MKKAFLIVLIFIFVAITVAGIYKFNFTNDDIYITNNDGKIVPFDELQDTIYFDELDQKWKDEYGVCYSCTFENGFNPHGWLLSDAEQLFIPKVIVVNKSTSLI